AAARDVRHALATQLEARARLRAGRNLQLLLAVDERYAHVAAEREHREGHRQLAVEIVLLAVEQRVILDVHDDVEIAGRAAGAAVFPLAVEAQPLAGRDAGRDLRGELALAPDAARAAAGLARTADDLAAAAAGGAGTRHYQEALLES